MGGWVGEWVFGCLGGWVSGAQVADLSLSDPAAAVQPGISRLPKDYAPDEEEAHVDEDEVLIAKNKAMTLPEKVSVSTVENDIISWFRREPFCGF